MKARQQEKLAVFFQKGKQPSRIFGSALEAIKILAPYHDHIMFDMDRVIVPWNSDIIYPEFHEIMGVVWDEMLKKSIGTNKGGPAWGEHIGDPTYPTVESERTKMKKVLIDGLGFKANEIFVSWGYQKGAEWLLPKAIKYGDPGSDPYDRKPKPGMILKAMAYHGVEPSRTLFVGDALTDVSAAAAAKANALLVKMEMY